MTPFIQGMWDKIAKGMDGPEQGLVFGRRDRDYMETQLFRHACAMANPAGMGGMQDHARDNKRPGIGLQARFIDNVTVIENEDGTKKMRGVRGKMIGGKARLFRP